MRDITSVPATLPIPDRQSDCRRSACFNGKSPPSVGRPCNRYITSTGRFYMAARVSTIGWSGSIEIRTILVTIVILMMSSAAYYLLWPARQGGGVISSMRWATPDLSPYATARRAQCRPPTCLVARRCCGTQVQHRQHGRRVDRADDARAFVRGTRNARRRAQASAAACARARADVCARRFS